MMDWEGVAANPTAREAHDVDDIRIEPLTTARILQVFPLIREAVPQVRLDEWTRFARARTKSRGPDHTGIRVATTGRNAYPSGLYCYRIETRLSAGNILVADHLVAIDIINARPVFDRLIGDLENLALRLNCHEVRRIIQQRSTQAAQPLFAAGHHPQGMVFARTLDGVAYPLRPVALT